MELRRGNDTFLSNTDILLNIPSGAAFKKLNTALVLSFYKA
jgi:hypothetical protein